MAKKSSAADPFAAAIDAEIAHRNSPAFILSDRSALILKAKEADIKETEIAAMAIKSIPGLAAEKNAEVLEAVREIIKTADTKRRSELVDLVLITGKHYVESFAAQGDENDVYTWLKGEKPEVEAGVVAMHADDVQPLHADLTNFADKRAAAVDLVLKHGAKYLASEHVKEENREAFAWMSHPDRAEIRATIGVFNAALFDEFVASLTAFASNGSSKKATAK